MRESTLSWPKTLLLLLATLVWILFWYWDTGRAMVAIWARSDTYAHAFVVPPITLWLIWRKRHELASLRPAPTLWFIGPLGATALLWLMGELTCSQCADAARPGRHADSRHHFHPRGCRSVVESPSRSPSCCSAYRLATS